jgi:hypothetical protein
MVLVEMVNVELSDDMACGHIQRYDFRVSTEEVVF